jgi:hypothetical protein
MSPLDVLSLVNAKEYLKVDFVDDDLLITSLIKAAVSLVEKDTNYRLYNRPEIINLSTVYYDAFQYPLISATVLSMDSSDTNVYTVKQWFQSLRTKLFWGNGNYYVGNNGDGFYNPDMYMISACPSNYQLTLNVGFTDTTLIPDDLLTAIKQIVVFTYENRDLTKLTLPDNIMLLLANYRRFTTLL